MTRFPFGLPGGAAACRAPSMCSSAGRICMLGKSARGFRHQLLLSWRPRYFCEESGILERVPRHKVVQNLSYFWGKRLSAGCYRWRMPSLDPIPDFLRKAHAWECNLFLKGNKGEICSSNFATPYVFVNVKLQARLLSLKTRVSPGAGIGKEPEVHLALQPSPTLKDRICFGEDWELRWETKWAQTVQEWEKAGGPNKCHPEVPILPSRL